MKRDLEHFVGEDFKEAYWIGFHRAKNEMFIAIQIGPLNEVIQRMLHLGEDEVSENVSQVLVSIFAIKSNTLKSSFFD